MYEISDEQLAHAAAILGSEGVTDKEIEAGMLALFPDPMAARRAIDWIPEAFAFVLVPHIAEVELPTTFTAKARNGTWMRFETSVEPVFAKAVRLGTHLYHSGNRDAFGRIALRSAMMVAVNRALNAGHGIAGATLSGPALLGVPAEFYLPPGKPWWRRILRPGTGG